MDAQDRNRKKAWKTQERNAAKDAFPLPDGILGELFAHVSAAVDHDGCDHTLKATEAWLGGRLVDRLGLLAWLEKNGGYCDCEVVANAADHWEQNR